MNRRDSLVRLKRFRVDELKRHMATLDGMRADLGVTGALLAPRWTLAMAAQALTSPRGNVDKINLKLTGVPGTGTLALDGDINGLVRSHLKATLKHLACLEYSTVVIQNRAIDDFLAGRTNPDLRLLKLDRRERRRLNLHFR